MSFVTDIVGAGAGGALSYLGAQANQDALKKAIVGPTTYSGQTTGQQTFNDQSSRLPQVAALLETASNIDNDAFRERLAGIDSTILARIAQESSNASTASQGGLPPEVMRQIESDANYDALQRGYAGTSFAASELKKRIALARFKRKTDAPALTADALKDAAEVTPEYADVVSTLISPGAITARQNALESRNAAIAAQNASIGAATAVANNNSMFGGISQGLGAILSTAGSLGSASAGGGTGYSSAGGVGGASSPALAGGASGG